jgi:acetylglutamate kinase
MEPADVVLRFLESVGRRSEAEFYLALFRALPKEGFAAISVDAGVARHAGEAVVLDLRVLAALGLSPLVLLGLLEPTSAIEHAARIVRRLERAGVRAEIVANQPADDRAGRIAASIAAGVLPVLVLDPQELPTVEDRVARVGALLTALRTRKLIFLHRPGPLRARGGPVSLVNLTTEFEALHASKELSRKEHLILAGSRRLVLEQVPHKLTVAITSPLDLLRELFTEKGAGTLLRRGSVIERRAGYADLDVVRLRSLLASSFRRDPEPSVFDREVARVYLEEGYRGVAIVAETPLGSYLTKFAVEREAQGEGLGRDLWTEVTADHPTLFWRARAENPVASWYTKQCDGMARSGEWQVFWRGLAPAQIADAIAFALAQPIDFPAPAPPDAGGA